MYQTHCACKACEQSSSAGHTLRLEEGLRDKGQDAQHSRDDHLACCHSCSRLHAAVVLIRCAIAEHSSAHSCYSEACSEPRVCAPASENRCRGLRCLAC